MNDKNYIERVTNLTREKVKYIPKSILDDAISTLIANTDAHDFDEDKEIAEYIASIEKKANEAAKEMYIVEEDDPKKKWFRVCPYCGGDMELRFVYEPSRNIYKPTYDRVRFECFGCGSTSPYIPICLNHLNEEKIREDICRFVERSIDNEKYADEEDE